MILFSMFSWKVCLTPFKSFAGVLRLHQSQHTLTGDFNCDPAECGLKSRTPPAMAMLAAPPSSPPSLTLLKLLNPFSLVRTYGVTVPSTLSRIDRVFVNLPMAKLRDFQCHSHTIGTVGDKSEPGDHITVRLVIECPRREQLDHPVIRRWPTASSVHQCLR